jgi:hypothetical protein
MREHDKELLKVLSHEYHHALLWVIFAQISSTLVNGFLAHVRLSLFNADEKLRNQFCSGDYIRDFHFYMHQL